MVRRGDGGGTRRDESSHEALRAVAVVSASEADEVKHPPNPWEVQGTLHLTWNCTYKPSTN